MKNNREKVYAFIDAQNLNYGTMKDILRNNKIIYRGWKLDFSKFRRYLKDKFKVEKAFLFIGYIESNKNLYQKLEFYGYTLIFKQTVKVKDGSPKGNVDAELVLHAAKIEYDNYDGAVIVSGDGDFYCLHKFLNDNRKLKRIVIPNSKSESTLLKEFHSLKTYIQYERSKVEYINNGRRYQ